MQTFEIIERLNENWQGEFPGLAKLEFSDWTSWDRREKLSSIEKTGVYILGKFDSDRERASVDLLDEHVIYFGMTNLGKTTSLSKRLRDFNVTAFGGRSAHAGGSTYKDEYGSDQTGLYVAICPIHWNGEDALSLAGGVGTPHRVNFTREQAGCFLNRFWNYFPDVYSKHHSHLKGVSGDRDPSSIELVNLLSIQAPNEYQQTAVFEATRLLEVCLRGIYVFNWGRLPVCNKE